MDCREPGSEGMERHYHWRYRKTETGAIVCEECGGSIEDVPNLWPIGSDHFLSRVDHKCGGAESLTSYGFIVMHIRPDGAWCEGALKTCLACVETRADGTTAPTWTTESADPLTLSPSILCTAEGCGDHGYIREGRWVA